MSNAKEILRYAIRLYNDVNGNPRYYIPTFCFFDKSGKMYRPKYCQKYRGKQFGAGWVFQSYNLEEDLRRAICEEKES